MDNLNNFFERMNFELDNLLVEEKPSVESSVKKPICCLSAAQIDEHFNKHYKGYIKGLKEARGKLEKASLSDANQNGSDFRSAMLDISFNYNGVVLHEAYFKCLGTSKLSGDLLTEINRSFGSEKKFMSLLKASLLASRGWVMMGFDQDWKLAITLVDSHDSHGMLMCPVMAIDVWEHAYYIDYKSDKLSYVIDIIDDINWEFIAEKSDKILSLK